MKFTPMKSTKTPSIQPHYRRGTVMCQTRRMLVLLLVASLGAGWLSPTLAHSQTTADWNQAWCNAIGNCSSFYLFYRWRANSPILLGTVNHGGIWTPERGVASHFALEPYKASVIRSERIGQYVHSGLPLAINRPTTPSITNDIWTGGAGNWSNGSMWSAGVPNASDNALIDNGNSKASPVTLDVSAAINSLGITSGDSLSFKDSTALTVNGGSVSNSGKIIINGGSATNTYLVLGANSEFSDGGTVTLNTTGAGGGNAFIEGNGVILTNKNNTIQGDGIIGNGSLTVVNEASGIIDANSAGNGLISTLTLNGSGGIANAGLLEASGSGVLQLQTTVNNAGGNITANGGTVQLFGTVEGGTLNTTAGGTLETVGSAVLDGSTNGAVTLSKGSTYTSPFSSTTYLLGTINNNGSILLNGGSATNTYLALNANTTLQGSGGGTVTLNTTGAGGGNAFIEGNGVTLTNVNNTIQGEGIIGNGTLAVVNDAGGTINANSAGNGLISTLTLNGSGGVTNAGLLEATGTGVLLVNTGVNNAGGNIAANGGTVELLNATIQGGTLTNTGGLLETPNGYGGTILDGRSVAQGGQGPLTIAGTYTSDFNSATTILGTIDNKNNIQLNGGSATNTYLVVGSSSAPDVSLQGGGKVTLATTTSGGGNAFIEGNGATLTNKNNTIQGDGIIGNSSLTVMNQATINANSTGSNSQALSLTLNGSGGIVNTGLLEATNAGVLVINNTVNNTGGNITANGGTAAVVLAGSTVQCGTLNTFNGGTMETSGSAVLDGSTNGAVTLSKGSTYTSPLSSTTYLLGTINNNGSILLNGGSATNTYLALNANTTLQGSGGGTVTLNTTGAGGGNAFIEGNGVTLTNVNNTIQGEGIIGNGTLAVVNDAGGTINANSAGNGLISTLTLNGSGGVTNASLMEATATGVLVINNTVNNVGGNITANGSAAAVVLAGGTIQGGTLNTLNGGTMETSGSAVLDGSTKGSLTLSKGSTYTSPLSSTTYVLGTINDNGNIQLNGGSATNTYMALNGNTTLQGSGGGTVTLSTVASGGGNAFIEGNNLTLTNTNNVIQGAGIIGNGSLTLVNAKGGTLFANASSQTLLINASGSITNDGTMRVASGSGMHVANGAFTNFAGTTLTGGTYNVGGTLEIDELGNTGGEIVTNAANIILNGSSSSFVDAVGDNALLNLKTNAKGSSFTIEGGRNFTTAGKFTNNGTLTVGSSNSTLKVSGSLTNFSTSTLTLTGGTYNLTGTLKFKDADIVTNAANITLSGSSSKIVDQHGNNGLANFATNDGSFTINNGRTFTMAGGFTNNATLTVGSGNSTFDVNGNLTNFSVTTLTGGTYNLDGTLQFNGANIVTNAADITLTGASSQITDQHGNNGLANFATNRGGFAINGGRNFTTAGNFTNNGTLTVGSGNSSFAVNGNLTNFSGTTLTGGTYNLTGTLQFNGANIVTNAANITLTGTSSQITDQHGNNGLANFATNNGTFALAGSRSFTTAENFANSGGFTINTGSTFALGGSGMFTQSGGTTTDNGTLSAAGAVNLQAGSLFGTGSITGSVQSSGTVTPGDSATLTGILTDKGTYTQNSKGDLDISIGGATAGSKFDELNSTSANLNGTLNIGLINGYVPKIGNTFKIMNFTSKTGTFSTVNGLNINSQEHFTITYQGTDVLLTVVSGALPKGQPINSHFLPGAAHQPPMFGHFPMGGIFSDLRFRDQSPNIVGRVSARFHPGLSLGKVSFMAAPRRSGLTTNFRALSATGSRQAFSEIEPRRPNFSDAQFRISGAPAIVSASAFSQAHASSYPGLTPSAFNFAAARGSNPADSFRTAIADGGVNPFSSVTRLAFRRSQFAPRPSSFAPAANPASSGLRGVDPRVSSAARWGSGNVLAVPRNSGASAAHGSSVPRSFSVSLSNVMTKPKLGFGIQ